MLLDSNLIIYASQPQYGALRKLIAREAPYGGDARPSDPRLLRGRLRDRVGGGVREGAGDCPADRGDSSQRGRRITIRCYGTWADARFDRWQHFAMAAHCSFVANPGPQSSDR